MYRTACKDQGRKYHLLLWISSSNMSGTEQGGNNGKVLEIVGMSDGVNRGKVIGAEDLQLSGPLDQSVKITGLQGGENYRDVTGARNIVLGSGAKAPMKGDISGTFGTFGHSDTVALLVAGAGDGNEVFKKDVEKMRTLLTSERVGISEDKMYPVIHKPTSKIGTKRCIKEAIAKVKEELEGSENGHFIFFYSGHFDEDHIFLVDNKGNKMSDDYFDEEFAQDMLQIPAKYVLFILDMCYAASANIGAKKKGKDDERHVAPMPCLWEFFINRSKSKGKGPEKTGCSAEKIVQWASSLSHEESMFEDDCSYFTKAIIDVITNPEVGKDLREELPDEMTHATVLQVNKHVEKQLQTKSQKPDIKPPHADESYFEAYPHFAKVK